jgi:hypothetical protein
MMNSFSPFASSEVEKRFAVLCVSTSLDTNGGGEA